VKEAGRGPFARGRLNGEDAVRGARAQLHGHVKEHGASRATLHQNADVGGPHAQRRGCREDADHEGTLGLRQAQRSSVGVAGRGDEHGGEDEPEWPAHHESVPRIGMGCRSIQTPASQSAAASVANTANATNDGSRAGLPAMRQPR